MKSTGKSHWERFRAAVAAQDDEKAEALVALLTPADGPKLLALAEHDGDSRWWAIRGLAAVGGSEAISAVADALEAADPSLRAAAALALAALNDRHPQAAESLLSRLVPLLQDDDGLVRQSASDALAQCGDPAVDALAAALDSPHEGVRVRAATALHRIGTMKAAPPLYHHLEDANPLVRHYAYETLDRLGLLTNVLLRK